MWRWQQRLIRVAVYTDTGTSKDLSLVLKALAKYPELAVEQLKVKDIQAGRVAEFALVVFPGGTGGGEAKALGEDGREKIRQFVREGKGYIGICAGAYLASCDYPWSLSLLNAKVLDKQHWARGNGAVVIGLSGEGKKLLQRPDSDQVSIAYRQGPLLAPAGKPGLPPYTELARYIGEVALKGAPKGVMPGTTAIAAAEFGKGRVVCFSPHPEKTPGLEDFLRHAIAWIGARP
ncbi:BPL-N domain-containing protein [Armatimonas sp.]|uniref:BPL-N domain-containing protein n=1 Tax=Armatimonas sp. TaxID=1872638 RepID=UPI00374CECB3